MDDIIRIQRSFARKAQAQPDHRFGDFYSLVWKTSFLEAALDRVLANRGSRSAGIDGVTVKDFQDEKYRTVFIQNLSQELKNHTFNPSPGRRVYIPKANGQKRPLGILTIQDRVVQMSMKMVLEPIFESDFLDCSHGFRPGRRTMDCLVPIWRHVTRGSKHYWVVEGDIRACFDAVNHQILMGLLRKRIADKHVLKLLEAFLKAGVMEGQLFRTTESGTPQGGILSPLQANLYLHQFDLWWWRKYGCLNRNQQRQRRRHGLGNPILIRYADDWVLLWNGDKAGAYQLKEEAKNFLEQELKLQLSEHKTLVTHVDEGFTFLGFDIQRHQGRHGKPVVLIRPSAKSVQKFKHKIKILTRRSSTHEPVWYKILQFNQILRGWSAYYQHVNASATFSSLDWWVMNRMFNWARKKHGGAAWRNITGKYRRRDPKGRINFVTPLEDGSPVWLYRMSDRPIRRYRTNWNRPTYADAKVTSDIQEGTLALLEPVSYPAREQDQVRLVTKRRDNNRCQLCLKANTKLHVHHIVPKRLGGKDNLDNLITLCADCHRDIHSSNKAPVPSLLSIPTESRVT